MTAVRPFRGLRYDPARVDLSSVIVPPYDVIAADERGSFYDRDPHNAIRFELTREVADEASADYADIASTLESWQRSGVLVRDGEAALYAMRQRYVAPSGEKLERTEEVIRVADERLYEAKAAGRNCCRGQSA